MAERGNRLSVEGLPLLGERLASATDIEDGRRPTTGSDSSRTVSSSASV